jgi:hypothetical protein
MLLSLPFIVFFLNKVQSAIVLPAPQTSSYRLFIMSASCLFCSIISLSMQSYCMPNASRLHDMSVMIVLALSVKVSALQLITEVAKYKLDRGGIQELQAVWKRGQHTVL